MTKGRRLAAGGTLIVGLVTLLSIGSTENIHSSPATHVRHPVALRHGVSVIMNPKTGKVVALGNGAIITMNPKTGRIVSVTSMPTTHN
jgi:cell division protein FtsI/penicillin-binding protein 2